MPNGVASRERQQAGARLFIVYALASLVPVVGLGGVLVHAAQQSGASRALAQGRSQAAVIMQMAIAPSLNERSLENGLNPRERARLQSATDLSIYSGSLTAVRLRSFSGSVVFSDDGSKSDELPTSDPAFRKAAGGGTSVTVTRAPGRASEESIRVLQPVIPNATGEATGVLELYLPYAPIAAVIHEETRATYVRLAIGLVVLYLVLAAISWSTTGRLRRHAAKQAHQAMHDSLTSLPNRAAFRAFAEQAIADRERGGALVLIDLNRFKEVNDTMGHHAGDQLLQCVAQRLVDSVRTDDEVARLGGDEFGLILPGATDPDEVMTLLEGIHRNLGVEVTIEGKILSIEASLGVALFPEHGTDLDQLLIDADSAMYLGKRGVRKTVVFEPGSATPSPRWHETQAELQGALDRDELVLHYQPKVSLTTGRVVGVEALARWNHPTRGLLQPAEFVPAAEASSLIGPFTSWALRRALADLEQWRAQGEVWPVSVNVSAHNLETPGFPDFVVDVLGEAGVNPADLVLELTETALAADNATIHQNIKRLAEIGVAVSVDDFGTGASGLVQLRGLRVSEIKIDRVFVRDLAENLGDQILARAVVQLAHGMDWSVVAEGVEDEVAAAYLHSIGCDVVQGFLYQQPVPWEQLVDHDGAVQPVLDDPAELSVTVAPATVPQERPLTSIDVPTLSRSVEGMPS